MKQRIYRAGLFVLIPSARMWITADLIPIRVQVELLHRFVEPPFPPFPSVCFSMWGVTRFTSSFLFWETCVRVESSLIASLLALYITLARVISVRIFCNIALGRVLASIYHHKSWVKVMDPCCCSYCYWSWLWDKFVSYSILWRSLPHRSYLWKIPPISRMSVSRDWDRVLILDLITTPSGCSNMLGQLVRSDELS